LVEKIDVASHLNAERHASDLVQLLVAEVEVAAEDDGHFGGVFVKQVLEAQLQLLQALARMILKPNLAKLLGQPRFELSLSVIRHSTN